MSDKVNRRSIQNSNRQDSDNVKVKRKRFAIVKKGLLDVVLEKVGGERYVKGVF